jgi:hypothetical protein
MNPMNLMFLFMLGETAGSGSGKDTMQRFLPAMTPGPTGLMLAAVFAKKAQQSQAQADKDREEANRDIIEEVIKIDEISSTSALKNKFPKLHDLFLTLPEAMQGTIFPAAPGGGRTAASRKP